VSNRLFTKFVKEQKHYVVESKSSVIEFGRSHPKFREPKIWQEGRIWAEFDYLNPAARGFVPKEAEFKEWYEIIAKWIRKTFKRIEHNTFLGPSAAKFRAKGRKLEIETLGRKAYP